MNIPKKIFTNEHLELFSSGQIRIPKKRFEFFNSGAFQANSKKAIRILHTAIRIHILESTN